MLLIGVSMDYNTADMVSFVEKHPHIKRIMHENKDRSSVAGEYAWTVIKNEVVRYLEDLPLREINSLKEGDILECCSPLKPSVFNVESHDFRKLKYITYIITLIWTKREHPKYHNFYLDVPVTIRYE